MEIVGDMPSFFTLYSGLSHLNLRICFQTLIRMILILKNINSKIIKSDSQIFLKKDQDALATAKKRHKNPDHILLNLFCE